MEVVTAWLGCTAFIVWQISKAPIQDDPRRIIRLNTDGFNADLARRERISVELLKKERAMENNNFYISPEAFDALEDLARRLSNEMFGMADFEYAFCNGFVMDELMKGRVINQAIRYGRRLLNLDDPLRLQRFFETCQASERWSV